MNRPALLDSSYLIDLERETAAGDLRPACRFLPSLRGRRIVVSIVSVKELLEGAADDAAALASLQRFTIQGLHLAQARRGLGASGARGALGATGAHLTPPTHSTHQVLLQRRASRRLGENDAWLIATAESIDADVVAADRAAFERLGARYLRFR